MTQWAKSPKEQSEGVRFLLIQQSKCSAILSKYTLTGCFFGDFAHWESLLTVSRRHSRRSIIDISRSMDISVFMLGKSD